MLKIRLQRFGKTNQAAFRVVLTDSRNSTKSGRFLEILGWHNPRLHQSELNKERVLYWMSKGVQLTGTLNNMMIKKGLIKGKKIHVSPNPPAGGGKDVVAKTPMGTSAQVGQEPAEASASSK